MSKVTPYKSQESKKDQVARMFDNISGKYDFLNHFFSLGIDIRWRKKAVKMLKPYNPKSILDIATGTGDFAFEALSLNPDKVTGVDISNGMLEKGREKVKARSLEDKVELIYGDSESLPFSDQSYDAIIVAFGVRNFETLEKGLAEMQRVLRPGGAAVILEFSKPKSFPIKQLYGLYFNYVMPLIGRLVSRDNSAYTYLPQSVQAFPEGKDFLDILKKVGFSSASQKPVTGGIASIYMAVK